jgi:hypothetical protein
MCETNPSHVSRMWSPRAITIKQPYQNGKKA